MKKFFGTLVLSLFVFNTVAFAHGVTCEDAEEVDESEMPFVREAINQSKGVAKKGFYINCIDVQSVKTKGQQYDLEGITTNQQDNKRTYYFHAQVEAKNSSNGSIKYKLISFSADLVYLCQGSRHSGSEQFGAKVIFEKDFTQKVSRAKAIIGLSSGTITKEFRDPLKEAMSHSDNKSIYMSGAKNSRINPFGDTDYLRFDGREDIIKYSELPMALSLSIDSLFGPSTNRGGDKFVLNCKSSYY